MTLTLAAPAVVPYFMTGGRELVIQADPIEIPAPPPTPTPHTWPPAPQPGAYVLEIFAGLDTPSMNSVLVLNMTQRNIPRFRLSPETTAMLVPVFAAYSPQIQDSTAMSLGSYAITYDYSADPGHGNGGNGGAGDLGVDEVFVGPNEPSDPDVEIWYDSDAVPGQAAAVAVSTTQASPTRQVRPRAVYPPPILVQSGTLTAAVSAKPIPPKYIYSGGCGCGGGCGGGSCSSCSGGSLCDCGSPTKPADCLVLTQRARVEGTWQGDWDTNKVYKRWDVVMYEGRKFAYIGLDGGMCSWPTP